MFQGRETLKHTLRQEGEASAAPAHVFANILALLAERPAHADKTRKAARRRGKADECNSTRRGSGHWNVRATCPANPLIVIHEPRMNAWKAFDRVHRQRQRVLASARWSRRVSQSKLMPTIDHAQRSIRATTNRLPSSRHALWHGNTARSTRSQRRPSYATSSITRHQTRVTPTYRVLRDVRPVNTPPGRVSSALLSRELF